MRAREAKKQGVRGGILADKMGYGKTCTAIGLIADTRRLSLARRSTSTVYLVSYKWRFTLYSVIVGRSTLYGVI